MTRDKEPQNKRPYRKPEISSEKYLEIQALGCAKVAAVPEPTADPCLENGFQNKSG